MKTAPPPRSGRSAAPRPKPQESVKFSKPEKSAAHRVLLYGPGGIGKSTLAAAAPGPVVFFDLDDSLGKIVDQLTDAGHDSQVIRGVNDWDGVRNSLHLPGWDEVGTIVIDSATKAEELAVAHTIVTVEHEKGNAIECIDDYGWGKGYGHVYDTFLHLLGDLDVHVAAGRNVILVCHDCTSTVPNPQGEDWIRYEPRLQTSISGKSSIRLRLREWADHVLFLGYDVEVKKGKGRGSSTRTLYPYELPHCMAKTRTDSAEAMVIEKRTGAEAWAMIFGKGGAE